MDNLKKNHRENKEFQERKKKRDKEREKTYSYSEYMKNLMVIAKNLLGQRDFRNIKKRKIKSFEFDGLDITTSSILATFPNIKERFNEECAYYFNDGRSNPLEMLLQCAFHYGYDSGEKHERNTNSYKSAFITMSESYSELSKKYEELKEKHED